jgi:hypothetical protein
MERVMSGQRRFFRKGTRKLPNFGLIAFLLLAALAIVVTLEFPGTQLQFMVGP